MGFLSSIPFLSVGSGVFGLSLSLLLTAVIMALWTLVLMILHPLHATLFVIAAAFEYALIYFFGFHIWIDLIAFFICYILLFAAYTLFLRRFLPLPKTEIELLIKLAQMKNDNLLDDEEFKKAKKKLLKL